MNIFFERYQTSQVLDATGMSNASLQSWLRRQVIVGGDDDDMQPGQPGIRRQYSFRAVMQIAVTKALTDLGVAVEHAAQAAGMFAHTNAGNRVPGLLFPNNYLTLLSVSGQVSRLTPYTPSSDAHSLAEIISTFQNGCVILPLNPLFERVLLTLGHDHKEILELSYNRNT